MAHIKAHDGAFYNEVADCAAKAGAMSWVATGAPLLLDRNWFLDPTLADWTDVALGDGLYRQQRGFTQ